MKYGEKSLPDTMNSIRKGPGLEGSMAYLKDSEKTTAGKTRRGRGKVIQNFAREIDQIHSNKVCKILILQRSFWLQSLKGGWGRARVEANGQVRKLFQCPGERRPVELER